MKFIYGSGMFNIHCVYLASPEFRIANEATDAASPLLMINEYAIFGPTPPPIPNREQLSAPSESQSLSMYSRTNIRSERSPVRKVSMSLSKTYRKRKEIEAKNIIPTSLAVLQGKFLQLNKLHYAFSSQIARNFIFVKQSFPQIYGKF